MGAPALRIFDCTTYLKPRPEGGYNAESGRANYDKGHIPGAAFLDLGGELSDPHSKLRFTLPPLGELTKAFAAKGIGHGTFVVLYSHATPNWATRLWWMLRAVGFDDVAILDGGLDKWKAENRPLSTEATTYPPATLTLRGRPEIFVDKNDIKGAIGKTDTLTLNALSHDQHKGTGGVVYGRAGRIAGSSCVPAASLFGPDKTLKPIAELRAAFEGVGAAPGQARAGLLRRRHRGHARCLRADRAARPQERLGVRQLHAGMVERPQPADGSRMRGNRLRRKDVAAYMIVEVETTDEALMAEYRKHTPGVIAKFGGKFIVRGGKTRTRWKAAGHHRAWSCSSSPTTRRPSASTIRRRLQAGARHAAQGRQVEGDPGRRP